ncbi:MAG: AAA family ATPase [Planctomycetota bacterium]|jgi:NadR type nicotinamide-nucleotide adenylyltransferase
MKKKVGLTLGKFAPLHRGHQYVIETALAETDHVIVLIYNCPELTSCPPLDIRSQWIRDIYPEIEVIEAWDGPAETGDTPEIKKRHEEYILKILSGRRVTHFYSSEFYGDHVSKALGAVNRPVDDKRSNYPISATEIRKDVFAHREYVHPRVYRDFIVNVVFLGAPSTGKTTIAERMAREYSTVWMPEYGREYWEKNQINRKLSLEQLVEIAEGHISREDELLYKARKYLFTDTNAITTYIFSLYYHGTAREKLRALAQFVESRYDLVFVCDADIPYDDTWDRSGETNREVFQEQIINDLIARKVDYRILKGPLEQRVDCVKDALTKYSKVSDNSVSF